MVKKTKIKRRPRRLFKDAKTDRYFYLIDGKKKYIKTEKGVSAKAVAKVNIQNILNVPVKRKTVRPRTSITPIIPQPIVTKLVPIAGVSANLSDSRLFRPKDDELEKRLTKMEERFNPTLVTPTTSTTLNPLSPSTITTLNPLLNVPTSTESLLRTTKVGEVRNPLSVPKVSTLKTGFTPPLTPIAKKFYDILMGRNKEVKKEGSKSPSPIKKMKKRMTQSNFDNALKAYEKQFKGDLTAEDYGKFLEWQQKSKVYDKYDPAPYDFWETDMRFLKELETLAPEEKQDLTKKARDARETYFVPEKKGSKIMVKRPDGDEETKGEAEIPTGTLEGFLQAGRGAYENDDDGIYNDELQEIFSDKMNKFLPVIASDKMNTLVDLVNKNTKKFGWIQNTDPSDSMGRHWVAYFIDIPNMEVNYYDSLVENDGEPPKSSLKGLKKIVDKINPEYYLLFKYNQIRDQHFKSKNCGYFSLKFIMDRYRNVPFKSATGYDSLYANNSDDDIVDNSGAGEMMIKRFKKYL